MDKAIVLGKRRKRDNEINWSDSDDDDNYQVDELREYNFTIMLPNGLPVELILNKSREDVMYVQEFLEIVKQVYDSKYNTVKKGKRKIMWKDPDVYFEDTDCSGIKIRKISFDYFDPKKRHYLKLYDGVNDNAVTFENMWDITPDTEILRELPREYSFETALADLIDNSLQAVWSNGRNEKRLVSVTIDECGLTIFDTGSGMDGTDKNSIRKWGTMGASLHRDSKSEAIGGKPPYLTPHFGMFGVGGPVASMHLGSHSVVSSKTRESKKVYALHFGRKALLKSGGRNWKADGGIRDPLEDEIRSSPHGSFTKVEIFKLKEKNLDTKLLKCRLKDIYFPYIQCDEMNAGRTATPVQFQVNGEDLAELQGGEIAITNMHSGNGEEFVLQLHISGLKGKREAHARLKCVYFPAVEGKESIDMILERLQEDGLGVSETFDTFSRTSVRRLGRLLPDARWGRLPFMEPKQRKGSKAQILKRCSMRVKCFIDTDAGFNPNNYKTDLATKDPCTIFLKTLGNKAAEKDTEANFVILRGGKHLTLSQLEKEYEEWIFQMHEYDHEIESNDIKDSAVVVVLTEQNQKEFGVRSGVVRVHNAIKRKGQTWKANQKLKILKGAGAGCHKQNMYATLEYILLDGLDGDSCGEVRLVCRPLDVPEEDGCSLKNDGGEPRLDIKSSKTFPISIIDDEKCKLMDNAELEKQLHWLQMKAPSGIDLLNAQECRKLGLDYALTFKLPVYAEDVISKSIVAVLRPASYDSSSSSRSLDQKFIVKDDLEMSMEITYLGEDHSSQQEKHVYAERIKHSARSGIQGLYIFKVGSKTMNSGVYKFLFTCSAKKLEKRLIIMPDTEVGRWKLLRDDKNSIRSTRVGSHLPCLSVACLDAHGDHVPFTSLPQVMVKSESTKNQIIRVQEAKTNLSFDRTVLSISEVCIESSMLDNIRPNYRTNLVIYSKDEVYSVSLPWQVTPGPLYEVKIPCEEIEKHLVPGSIIKKLVLEMLDKYNNHVESGVKVSIKASGLSFIDDKGQTREVDDNGFIDLSGVLKVTASYGSLAFLSVYYGRERFLKKDFPVDSRTLRIASEVPDPCLVESELKDITFEVVDSDDAVDETIHHSKSGDSHTLKIKTGFSGQDDSLEYCFFHGKCTVQSIRVPKEEGLYEVSAMHVNRPELCTSFQLRVTQPSTYFHEDVPSSTPKKRMPSSSWHEDVSFHSPKRRMPLTASHEGVLFHTPRRGTPSTPSYGDVPFQTPKTGMLLLKDADDLENDVTNAGEQVGQHEKKLKLLNDKKSMIFDEICQLQASLEPEDLTPLDFYTNDKEGMIKHIEGKANSAASAISKMMKYSLPSEHRTTFQEDIIGVVSLLGTVDNFELSRILAEYVGEDNMLAIVCKSSTTASDLEKYYEHGIVDPDSVLYQIASEFGMSVNGTFLVFCLEELSPFKGKIIKGDPQRKLDLPDPCLSTGKVPNGFLGYAVNFINLEANCVDTRTSKGHGLRETLFYSLFGELQVYESKDCMKQASSCLKNGAVSLDGGIIKGNNARSFGLCNPVIRFPVESMEAPSNLSQETINILREVEQKKLDLEETSVEIERETQVHSDVMKVFMEKKERLNHYLTEKEATVGSPQVHSQAVNDSWEKKERFCQYSHEKEVKVERLGDD